MATYENSKGLAYPLTKMNFLVTVDGVSGTAAFSEVTGVEATVDVIEFRQGNANSLAPVKIPGLVKHGNVTLKMGYTLDSAFNGGAPQTLATAITGTRVWVLTNAWVTKYNAPDLDAKTSDVAIESVEIAYEELVIPN